MSQTPTNTPANSNAPAPSGSNKKLLIIILCIVGVVLFLCCGGVTTCVILAKRAATSAHSSAMSQLEQIQKELEAEAKKQQAAAEKEAKKNNNPTETPTETPTTPTTPATDAGDFPTDVKLYAPAKTIMENSAEKTTMITATTPSAIQTVYDFYNSQLTRNGWTRTQTGTYVGSRVATYSKDKRTLSLVISTADKQTMIQISHTTN